MKIRTISTMPPPELQAIASRGATGFASPAADYFEQKIDLNRYLLTRPAASFLVWVSGDSMRDAGIYDGDLLVVDRSLKATVGQIVVAVVDGEFTLKRLASRDGKLVLEAADPNGTVLRLDNYQEASLWGVATVALHFLNGQNFRRDTEA